MYSVFIPTAKITVMFALQPVITATSVLFMIDICSLLFVCVWPDLHSYFNKLLSRLQYILVHTIYPLSKTCIYSHHTPLTLSPFPPPHTHLQVSQLVILHEEAEHGRIVPDLGPPVEAVGAAVKNLVLVCV